VDNADIIQIKSENMQRGNKIIGDIAR